VQQPAKHACSQRECASGTRAVSGTNITRYRGDQWHRKKKERKRLRLTAFLNARLPLRERGKYQRLDPHSCLVTCRKRAADGRGERMPTRDSSHWAHKAAYGAARARQAPGNLVAKIERAASVTHTQLTAQEHRQQQPRQPSKPCWAALCMPAESHSRVRVPGARTVVKTVMRTMSGHTAEKNR
jgi:hypothetical protein